MGDSLDGKGRIDFPYTGLTLPLNLDLSRRDILKNAGYGSLAAFIAACGGGATTTGTTTGGTLTVGSNESDPGPRTGVEAIVKAFSDANGGTKVTLNTVDHGTFQDQISS